jgi:lipopolysaccharide/colanic/teichoic acid biosynthesis glycosyltransferase
MSGDFVLTERLTKRIFDIVTSGVALVILSPLMVLSALAIRLESRGPVFFRQERVGRFGKKFQIVKLRTMTHRQDSVTAQVTSGDDQRITRIGRFLRRTKIDETPQFWNVLRGEMSVVGPRPEVERFVSVFPKEFDEVLSVRPGITDLASISFVDEEARLRGASDVEKLYVESILPEKLKLQKAYVQRASFLLDMKIIILTGAAILGYRRFKT